MKQSETWFAIPTMVRADNGYYHRHQTHDLIIVHQKWGELQSMTPVEIKSVANRKAVARYKALLVRGKMHLSIEGKYRPEETLAAITAVYEGNATSAESRMIHTISDRLNTMVRTYYAGEKLGVVAAKRSVMDFRQAA